MVGKFLFFLSAATVTFLGLSAGAVTTSQNVDIIVTHGAHASSAPGPLTVLGTNPHYFKTPDGKGVYLTGFHTWTGAFSFSSLGNFSFTAFVDYLSSFNVNFVRYWNEWMETVDGPWHNDVGNVSPLPFNRSGTGGAFGGLNKFDLTSFNQPYFDTLKTNVEYAGAHGMYVMVLLFVNNDYGGWGTSYWNGTQNINGTTTDVAAINSSPGSTTLALQQAYVRKVLDTLATEPNVLYEVANEPGITGDLSPTFTWQQTIVSTIHSYEASRGYLLHPVGVELNNSQVALTAADFVSPYDNLGNPPVYNLGKPVVGDTDHYFGIGGGTDWWWKAVMNGNNMLSMDDMHGTGLVQRG